METLIRYLVVAVLAYLIDMGGFCLLIKIGADPVAANLMVKVVAAIFGFFMHRRFTYRIGGRVDIGSHAKKYFSLALAYTPASSIVLFLVMLVLPHPVYAKAISDVLLFAATYWITTKFTFLKGAGNSRLRL